MSETDAALLAQFFAEGIYYDTAYAANTPDVWRQIVIAATQEARADLHWAASVLPAHEIQELPHATSEDVETTLGYVVAGRMATMPPGYTPEQQQIIEARVVAKGRPILEAGGVAMLFTVRRGTYGEPSPMRLYTIMKRRENIRRHAAIMDELGTGHEKVAANEALRNINVPDTYADIIGRKDH